ncbi:MAG: hypothetical protein CSA36_07375 [Draconibacterium sp.]|nr:MAG: hypothetical protein CSA36_07375 [Draconibacterium sp.]
MMLRRFLGLVLIVGLTFKMGIAQKSITYEDALKICLENNLGIKAGQSHIKAKEKEMKAQRGLFLPRVSLFANYTMISDDITIDMNPIKESIMPLYSALSEYGNFSDVPNPDPATNTIMPTFNDDISTMLVRQNLADGLKKIEASDWNKMVQKKNFGSLNANFLLPLYAGGKVRAGNKAASIYHKEAINEQDVLVSELSSTLVERYFGLVLAREALKVRQEVFQTMEKHLSDAQKMKDEGVIPNADFLHIKVYYSEAQRERKKAERTIDIAEEGLSNLLSNQEETTFLPISNLFINDDLPSLDVFLAEAKTNSLLLKKVDFKKQLLKTKHGVELKSYLPTVAVSGTYRLAEKDISEMMPKYFVGVGVQWNIFDGATRFKKLQSSKLESERIDLTYQKVESDINAIIIKLYNEAKMYIEEFEDLKTAEAFAEEYYRVRQKAFLQGISTTSEVSDANLAKAKVRIERLQAMYHYDSALAKLLYYTGKPEAFKDYQHNGHQ